MRFAALARRLSICLNGVARAITLEDLRTASQATSGDQPLSGILTAPGLAPRHISLYVSANGSAAQLPADFVLLGVS